MVCQRAEHCARFLQKVASETTLSTIYNTMYCTNYNEACARFIVMENLGPEQVTDTLFPNMLDVAHSLLTAPRR